MDSRALAPTPLRRLLPSLLIAGKKLTSPTTINLPPASTKAFIAAISAADRVSPCCAPLPKISTSVLAKVPAVISVPKGICVRVAPAEVKAEPGEFAKDPNHLTLDMLLLPAGRWADDLISAGRQRGEAVRSATRRTRGMHIFGERREPGTGSCRHCTETGIRRLKPHHHLRTGQEGRLQGSPRPTRFRYQKMNARGTKSAGLGILKMVNYAFG